MYPIFLDIGHSPSLFWESSLDEIYDFIDSYKRQEEKRQKEREAKIKDEAAIMYNLAMQIGEVMSQVLHPQDGWQRLKLSDYYPELFEDVESKEQQAKDELALHKARMDEFAFRHNRMRGEKHRRDDT